MTESPTTTRIPVTVDKSHIITIGEKLYAEKTSFIRELVNNAYDADATEVHIDIRPSTIVIRDNGSGMDEEGLRKYFTIGASEKRANTISERFQRHRIGEFGIGKFAALAASSRFEVETARGDFRARLVFDKEAWSRHEDWHINIETSPPDPLLESGTTITLHNPTLSLIPGKVRRYLAERTPINVPNFKVFLNGEMVSDEITAGKHLAIKRETPYGMITGTITIVPPDRRVPQLGIGVMVKGVLVRYESFGLETSRKLGVSRITGRINADFLPITSSRDDFIRDSHEFSAFYEAVKKEVQRAVGTVRDEVDQRANLQASRVLKDALTRIGKAMRKNKELFPNVQLPLGGATSPFDHEGQPGYEISQAQFLESHAQLDPSLKEALNKQGKEKRTRGRPIGMLGNKSVIRTLHIANLDIAVRMEHLGDDEETRVVGGVIYLNLDHPLYKTYRNADELLTLHVARVITKELALQTGTTDPERAFAIQSELLTEALKGKGV